MKTRTLISGAVAVTAAGALTIAATAVAQAQETGGEALTAAIDLILADPALTDSQVGVLVRDADTGEVLYDRNGNQRGLPGSNQKLTTMAGALATLGEGFRFTTELLGDRPVDGVVAGDLYLRGSGDTTMLEADYDRLAADLAAAGVSTVDGDLVLDDTAFDDVRHAEEVAWGDLQFSPGAEVSALTIGSGTDHWAGTARLFMTGGAAEGDPVAIRMVPENGYVTVVNEATTGAETDLTVNRDEHANTIRVTGTVEAGVTPDYYSRSVIDPTALVADVFADSLADNGIDVTGGVRLHEPAPQEAGGTLVLHESKTLLELTPDLLKPSNNSLAESLMKSVALHNTGLGTFADGEDGIHAAIAGYGVDTATLRQADGSGMSRFDQATPEAVTDLLIGVRQEPWYDAWFNGLPVACTDGTLASRMCGTSAAGNVHAKTGTQTSVSALSGYVTDADGRELVFSIILNDHLVDSVKYIENQVAVAIASHSADATEAEISRSAATTAAAEPDAAVPGGFECSWYEPAVC
ncbi:D-alanyl-D-alanine carboxypeptidase/D-alanyl-D-alanine-endopeptidase [Glycomyces algeriensis]|uniref:D-alanyl-D-alanine carboxypeptidase DacC n=1 Tax=Glycomyces algeriensis TaxID=256037 RepID=A0A9W6G5C6_9ACTN|nr:D-alanyl-D-alanine carboxypeptidase/D-alanyl-D-alanine-endopeptidase [Glycomyces algeriensis]MDA1366327.1 D-alanyl-D-alanine carboxypeptidase/D-alanyl-D-alanine-endopeptidase [Glycomyces algeriensis]MDR7348673.1 D-alanyl-D-alanine carboxypeptidase/D-alanyl-D-alanine-endopeptidase (penicillin-binding protein 4) [Glycomyces algeriensis]GLI41375.1 D-alanyl-D-alanine carboxypeptidase DacC [Glycomyces algeriensis]